MPDGAGHGLEGRGSSQFEFSDCDGELRERVALGTSVNEVKELVDALDIELVAGGLADACQEANADVTFVAVIRVLFAHSGASWTKCAVSFMKCNSYFEILSGAFLRNGN